MSTSAQKRPPDRNLLLEVGRDGKFVAKTVGWGENRVLFEDDKLEVAVKNGRLVITHLPAGWPPEDPTSRRSRWRVTVTEQRQSDVVT